MLELGGWVVHAMHCCLGLAQGVGSRGGQISLMLQNGRGQRALRVVSLQMREREREGPTGLSSYSTRCFFTCYRLLFILGEIMRKRRATSIDLPDSRSRKPYLPTSLDYTKLEVRTH